MLRTLVIVTAMLGYVLSFHSVYAFHIVALVWVYSAILTVSYNGTISIQYPKLLLPILLLTIYLVASAFWVVDIKVWARYIVYWLCGLTALLAAYQSVWDKDSLWRTFFLIGIVWLANMGVGFFETLGAIRLPMSPYSPHVYLFGYSGIDLSTLRDTASQALSRMPTGFNWNQNDFGFVLMLGLPFVVLFHKKEYAFPGLLLALYLLLSIGSKGIFLSLLVLFLLLPLYLNYSFKRISILIVLLVALIAGFTALLASNDESGYGATRILSIYDQLARGANMVVSDSNFTSDSTGTRAHIYRFGIEQFLSSKWLGLGLGGIESSLMQQNFKIQSFHFFFLQMLIDLGAIVFGAFIASYLWLALKLRTAGLKSSDPELSYLARACSLALVIAIPATISPSGVHYELTYYIVVGLGLSILKVYLMEKRPT